VSLRRIAAFRAPGSQERLLATFKEGHFLDRNTLAPWAEVLSGNRSPEVLPAVLAFLERRLASRDFRGATAPGLWRLAFERMSEADRSARVIAVLSDPTLQPNSVFRMEILDAIGASLSREAIDVVAQGLRDPNAASATFAALARLEDPYAHGLDLRHLELAGYQAANIAPRLGPRLTGESAAHLRRAAEQDPRVSVAYLAALAAAPQDVLKANADSFRAQFLARAWSKQPAVPYGRSVIARALRRAARWVATEDFVRRVAVAVEVSTQGRAEMLRALDDMRRALES